MLVAASGHSEDIDTLEAFAEIREQCEPALRGKTPQAALLFAGIDFEHQDLLDAINEAWPGIQLIGCTTDGELSSCQGFKEDSISLLLLASDTIEFTTGLGREVSQGAEAACSRAVAEARAKTTLEPSVCIATPESLTGAGQQIVVALAKALGDNVTLSGGAAGDQMRLVRTLQFFGREVVSDGVPILLLSGPLVHSMGVGHGWKPVGEPGVITRSDGCVVYEIDGAPAIDFYRRFLGDQFKPKPEFPLVIVNDDGEPEYLRETPGDIDEHTGAITYLADLPEGARVQVSITDRAAILDGCAESIRRALQGFPDTKKPEAAIIVSCAARRLLLGTKTGEEFRILKESIGDEVPFCGFYTYGEIGPQETDRTKSIMHHETFTILLLGT